MKNESKITVYLEVFEAECELYLVKSQEMQLLFSKYIYFVLETKRQDGD